MLLDFSSSAAARYPTDGQGGCTTPGAGPTGSMLKASRKVIVTGIFALTPPTADVTLSLVHLNNPNGVADGTLFPNASQPLQYIARSAAAGERGGPVEWEIDEGFGVQASATDATAKIMVTFRPVL